MNNNQEPRVNIQYQEEYMIPEEIVGWDCYATEIYIQWNEIEDYKFDIAGIVIWYQDKEYDEYYTWIPRDQRLKDINLEDCQTKEDARETAMKAIATILEERNPTIKVTINEEVE